MWPVQEPGQPLTPSILGIEEIRDVASDWEVGETAGGPDELRELRRRVVDVISVEDGPANSGKSLRLLRLIVSPGLGPFFRG